MTSYDRFCIWKCPKWWHEAQVGPFLVIFGPILRPERTLGQPGPGPGPARTRARPGTGPSPGRDRARVLGYSFSIVKMGLELATPCFVERLEGSESPSPHFYNREWSGDFRSTPMDILFFSARTPTAELFGEYSQRREHACKNPNVIEDLTNAETTRHT